MSSVQNIWLINIFIRVIYGPKCPVKKILRSKLLFTISKFESRNVRDSKSRNVHTSIFIYYYYFFLGGGGRGGGGLTCLRSGKCVQCSNYYASLVNYTLVGRASDATMVPNKGYSIIYLVGTGAFLSFLSPPPTFTGDSLLLVVLDFPGIFSYHATRCSVESSSLILHNTATCRACEARARPYRLRL